MKNEWTLESDRGANGESLIFILHHHNKKDALFSVVSLLTLKCVFCGESPPKNLLLAYLLHPSTRTRRQKCLKADPSISGTVI